MEHFWCTNEPRAHMDSQDSPWPKLGKSPHLLPYIILCDWPWGLHPNVIFPRTPKSGVPKFPKLGFPPLLKPITSCVYFQLRRGLKTTLHPLSKSFQKYVACHLYTHNLGRFPTFNGWESNWHFDFWPFFWP